MNKRTIEFEVSGDYALFTDPSTKTSGEKFSYPIPTYSALIGIVKQIYWKPTFYWVIDSVRIMNPIRREAKGIKPTFLFPSQKGGKLINNALAYYTYLQDVRYQVKAHYEFNPHHPELRQDWNENKHSAILNRCLKVGGKRPSFLGVSECAADVKPCEFNSGEGYYDHVDRTFDLMFHSFGYPDETGIDEISVSFWKPQMVNGIIHFPKHHECTITRSLHEMKPKEFGHKKNFKKVEELYDEMKKDGDIE